MKKIGILIISYVLLLSLCACGSEPSLLSTALGGDSSAVGTPAPDNSKVFKLGDTVELDNVTVSFVNITTSNGSDFNEPEDGNIFVLCEFEISNNSKKDLSVSSMLSFDAYCDGYTCGYSLSALLEKGNKNQLDGTIAAGKKMKGVIGYELPSDWQELEIHYTLDITKNSKIVFVATNN